MLMRGAPGRALRVSTNATSCSLSRILWAKIITPPTGYSAAVARMVSFSSTSPLATRSSLLTHVNVGSRASGRTQNIWQTFSLRDMPSRGSG